MSGDFEYCGGCGEPEYKCCCVYKSETGAPFTKFSVSAAAFQRTIFQVRIRGDIPGQRSLKKETIRKFIEDAIHEKVERVSGASRGENGET